MALQSFRQVQATDLSKSSERYKYHQRYPILKAATKTILDELTNGLPEHNRNLLIESRGNHLIASSINLLNSIAENYGAGVAEDMERRLLSSIRSRDPQKFSRAARRLL